MDLYLSGIFARALRPIGGTRPRRAGSKDRECRFLFLGGPHVLPEFTPNIGPAAHNTEMS